MCTRTKNISLLEIMCLSLVLSNNFIITRAQRSVGSHCRMNDQSTGICSKTIDCPWWIQKMRNHQYPADSERCAFDGLDIIVCCPQQESPEAAISLPNEEGTRCTMETDGGPGLCTAINRCEFRIEQIRQGKRFEVGTGRCSFHGPTEIVCCPASQRSARNRPQSNVRPAERACLQYQAMITGSDGFDVEKYIIGGEDAKPGEFPFMVALGYHNNPEDPTKVSYICGGSLITDRHVLTASHCIMNIDNFRPSEVLVGSVSLLDKSKDVQKIAISQIITHPSYRMSKNYFDVAVITLSKNVQFSNKTLPICLQTHPMPTLKSFLKLKMIATGWGITSFNDDVLSNNLQKTRELTLIDKETCAAKFQSSTRIPQGVDDSVLCILDENPVNRSDTCHGDSGGPLFLKSNVISSLIGIVSFGQSCASSIPAVYTSVYFHLDWIEQNVWPEGRRLAG